MIEQIADLDLEKIDPVPTIIDLRHANDQIELLARVGAVLRGSSYLHDVSKPSMDMLQELIEDWFEAHWGERKTILILGIKDRILDQRQTIVELVLMMTRAEMWTMERKLRSDSKADSMTPFLNLRIYLA